MNDFLLTIMVGVSVGYIFLKLRVPGGMMVGAIIGVGILSIFTGKAYMPVAGKVTAQIVAGAFIGAGLEKSDLIRLKKIYKPAIAILSALLLLNIYMGFLIHFISPLDLVTSFMCAIPGGMSDIPIISEDMGADSAKVFVMQFIRMVFGIGVFPSMINKISDAKFFKEEKFTEEVYRRNSTQSEDWKHLVLTITVAAIFGILGKISAIPSGTLVFSMMSVIALKLMTGKAHLPVWVRRMAQVLSGTYIGSGLVYSDLLEVRYLIIPAIAMIVGYALTCVIAGYFLHRKFHMPLKDAMLACTPAGAADMALIAADIGVESADIIVLQVIRLVVVVSVFPQIIKFIALLNVY